MEKQIFIINGSGGVGKDTFVELVAKSLYRLYGYTLLNYSSIDCVKNIAKSIGWNGGKTEKDRKFLSDLKILMTEYNDAPFSSMQYMANLFNQSGDIKILFLHIREPKEIERAKQAFNAKTILVRRDSIPHITSNMADNGVFDYQYDIEINNDGDLNDLAKQAEKFTISCFEEN